MMLKTKTTNRTFQIIVGLLFTLTLTGCFGVSENFEQIRNNVLSNIDGNYSKNIEMGFGSITLSLAEIFVSFADEEDGELMTDMLDNISEVQIATYKGKIADTQMNFQFLKKTTANLTDVGWQTLAYVKSKGSITSILYKENEDNLIGNMFVLTISDSELVLVELNGDLNKIVELVIKERGQNFNIAGNF